MKRGVWAAYDIGCRRYTPVLIASFRQALHDVCFVAHEPQKAHDLLPAGAYPPQHVALLRLLEDQHQLVDAVDLVLDALDKRAKRIGDIVDEGIGYPVGGDADVVLELLYAPADVLRMWSWPEVELYAQSVSTVSTIQE